MPLVLNSSSITGLAAVGGLSSPQTGSVLQAVYGSTSTQTEGSFSTATDLGLSASITPTSSSSKILVLVSANGLSSRSGSGTGTYWEGWLVRASTNIGGFTSYNNYNGADAANWGCSLCVLDSPATTSSITYKLQGIRRGGSNNCVFNLSGGNAGLSTISTITLLEIAA
jgi:hypothetical protein